MVIQYPVARSQLQPHAGISERLQMSRLLQHGSGKQHNKRAISNAMKHWLRAERGAAFSIDGVIAGFIALLS